MSSSSKSSDKVWLSLAFYVAYFTYFMSYAYEINYMVMYRYSYVLFFASLACSFTSVLFTSTVFEVLTMLLVFTKLAIESYIFLIFLAILKRPTTVFVRWFFFLRVVVTVLYLVLFWQYMKYLKSEKEKNLEEMRQIEAHVQQYNNKVEENERNRIANQTNPNHVTQKPEVAPPQAIPQAVPQVIYDPNQMNMTNGHYYQVAAPAGMPVNNPNMMYNPNIVYNPNVMYNPNMVNAQPQQAPVPLPIPTTVASITTPTNTHNNGTRTQYPYANINGNGNNNANVYGYNHLSHHQ